MAETTVERFEVRQYQAGEEARMVALVNACRASEWDNIITVDLIRDEWSDSRLKLDRDTWAAVNEAGEYIAVAEVWFNDPDNDEGVVTRHIGFAMHPDYRESHAALMEQILDEALHHASTHPFARPDHPYVLRAWAAAKDEWKQRIILARDFEHVHCGYTLERRHLADLPPVPSVEGVRLECWTPEREHDLWQALNQSFSTDPTFNPLRWEEWRELYGDGPTDPRLWWLAVDAETNEVVGLALTEIDREGNQESGQRDGWVVDLGVVPRWREQGLGRMLLLAAMHALREAGMSAIKMGIDSTEPAKATRLFDSVGFTILHGSHTYIKPLNNHA